MRGLRRKQARLQPRPVSRARPSKGPACRARSICEAGGDLAEGNRSHWLKSGTWHRFRTFVLERECIARPEEDAQWQRRGLAVTSNGRHTISSVAIKWKVPMSIGRMARRLARSNA